MTYRVVETITNLTDTSYDSMDAFIAQCYFNGYKESDIIQYWGSEIVKAGLGEDFRDNFILAASVAAVTFDSWDTETQTCIRESLWQSEDDYNLIQEVFRLTHISPSTRFSRDITSIGTV